MNEVKEVIIYTDGACLGNPGPGGYGAVLLHGGHRKEVSGGYSRTTNNRMEIMAVIAALESLTQPCRVTLHSDSQYVVNAITQGWARRWKSNGWKRNRQEPAINPDLWDRLLGLCDQHQVEFRWLRGHAGNVENERCDRLAVAAARQAELPVDPGYLVDL
jgi:ribonuclease HI